jgi:hypothetical protein
MEQSHPCLLLLLTPAIAPAATVSSPLIDVASSLLSLLLPLELVHMNAAAETRDAPKAALKQSIQIPEYKRQQHL